jgi:superfamily I DNA/RNA helicase
MPTWAPLGIDVRGRSTVMKESFRSTKEIGEFAFNALYRLQPFEMNEDHKELLDRGLIERTIRNERPWWKIRFNQNSGPKPTVKEYTDRTEEFANLADELLHLLLVEHVSPKDICIICNKQNALMKLMDEHVKPRLHEATQGKVDYVYKDGGALGTNTILVTSPHSFKGYESEIVFIPAADFFQVSFQPPGRVLAVPLYVAMTRARSLLKMSYTLPMQDTAYYEPANKMCTVLRECYADC